MKPRKGCARLVPFYANIKLSSYGFSIQTIVRAVITVPSDVLWISIECRRTELFYITAISLLFLGPSTFKLLGATTDASLAKHTSTRASAIASVLTLSSEQLVHHPTIPSPGNLSAVHVRFGSRLPTFVTYKLLMNVREWLRVKTVPICC